MFNTLGRSRSFKTPTKKSNCGNRAIYTIDENRDCKVNENRKR